MRQHVTLSGTWQFQTDPTGALSLQTISPDRTITVPLPWQAAFKELEHYSGFAWYRRNFDLSPDQLTGEILLEFGAVDYWCEVFVNGQAAGSHEGGYTPFTLPVARLCRAGANEVAVRVFDSAQDRTITWRWPDFPAKDEGGPPFDARNVPHGKQEWYINVGGIWQDVSLYIVPASYLAHVQLTPDFHSGAVAAKVELAGSSPSGQLRLKLEDAAGQTVAETAIELDGAKSEYNLSLTVPAHKSWSVDAPNLYTARLELANGDSLDTRFGFREIRTEGGKLWLNGEPLYLLSALDQDIYDETIYTVPSEEYLRDQFRKAKELGLNCLRCHIKPPDPLYLRLADEMGLLVWEEIPSWRTFYPKGTIHPNQLLLDQPLLDRVENTLVEMLRRDFNHPSIIIWTIVNEDWGTALPLSAADRAWVSRMYHRAKELDPTRLVVDNSPCGVPWGTNIHVETDLDDFHVYTNIPDQAHRWEQTVEQFNLRPVWTFSSKGDAKRKGDEPLILSEFGNWGMPLPRDLSQGRAEEPDWFKLGPWWSSWDGEPGWPAGVEARFKRLGLDQVWPDYETFAKATQWHEYRALKFEIEALRRQRNIQGYVITELSDIYWESNGLLDFRRNPKVFHNDFEAFNRPDVVVPQVSRYSYWDTETVTSQWYGSHYSQADWQGAKLSLQVPGDLPEHIESQGQLGPGEAGLLGRSAHKLTPVQQTELVRLEASLAGAQGENLAHNYLEVLVLPEAHRQAAFKEKLAVHAGDNLLTKLGQLGYQTGTQLAADTAIAVTTNPDESLLAWVRAGGKLLYLAGAVSPFFYVQGRGGTYSGSWITSFSWLKPQAHARLNSEGLNPLSLPFGEVMPGGTILGLPDSEAEYQGDFLAGQLSGWVQHPAVHTVQFRYGQGKVVMTTFALEKGLENGDPAGTAMFHDLVDYLGSERCQPKLSTNY